MSVRNLQALLRPESIAVIGASNRTGSVGTVVFRNTLRGGFKGRVMPVNDTHNLGAPVWATSDT